MYIVHGEWGRQEDFKTWDSAFLTGGERAELCGLKSVTANQAMVLEYKVETPITNQAPITHNPRFLQIPRFSKEGCFSYVH